MTRLEAIEALIREGQRDNLTKAGRQRVKKACEALDLDEAETVTVELILEYRAPTETERRM